MSMFSKMSAKQRNALNGIISQHNKRTEAARKEYADACRLEMRTGVYISQENRLKFDQSTFQSGMRYGIDFEILMKAER